MGSKMLSTLPQYDAFMAGHDRSALITVKMPSNIKWIEAIPHKNRNGKEVSKMKNVIYYFTGTGNSMRAAVKIAKRLGDTEIISMRNSPSEVSAIDCDTIGFVFPVYHWTMPEPVVQFIEKLEINPNAYIFGIAMPSLVLGYACEKLNELLIKKGAKLSFGAKVNSVANYAIVYNPFPSPKLVVPKTEKKLDAIADAIKNKQCRDYPKCSTFIRKKYPKVMPQYKSLQQFADEPFTVLEECISCGLCSKVCPCHNIELVEGTPTFLHHCAQCMACVCFCPKRAIGYKLTENHFEQLADSGLNVPVVKKMGLPPKRKLYHNPYITAADIAKNRMKID